VLLIQRAKPPYLGCWTLPGGRREPGEEPQGTARREIAEELGLRVDAVVPVTEITPAPGWRLAVFAAGTFDGDPAPSDEVAAWRWVTPEDAATLDTTLGLIDVMTAALRCVGQRP
jgi:8-oxo-dGTP diphosphatase